MGGVPFFGIPGVPFFGMGTYKFILSIFGRGVILFTRKEGVKECKTKYKAVL